MSALDHTRTDRQEQIQAEAKRMRRTGQILSITAGLLVNYCMVFMTVAYAIAAQMSLWASVLLSFVPIMVALATIAIPKIREQFAGVESELYGELTAIRERIEAEAAKRAEERAQDEARHAQERAQDEARRVAEATQRAAEQERERERQKLAELGHILYRLFDASGELIYIGITNDEEKRLRQHRATQPWWWEVASFELDYLTSRAELEAVERLAIIRERPRYNIIYNRSADLS